MAKKKKKLDEVVVEEIVEEVAEETIEVTIEEPVCKKKACDGMVDVKITDPFVKYQQVAYKKWDTLRLCKEIAHKAKWCKVL